LVTAPDLSSPWSEFLGELDAALREPVSLHCIGGFVVSVCYGLPRPTGDIDYYTAIPSAFNLEEIAGRGSPLAKKYKVSLQRVTVTDLPEEYETRLTEIFLNRFKKLRFFAPDPYDLILSKLCRNSPKDRDDAAYLFHKLELKAQILRERYQREFRPNLALPEREDLTLKLWIDIFQSET
jgi:hypothetical protein